MNCFQFRLAVTASLVLLFGCSTATQRPLDVDENMSAIALSKKIVSSRSLSTDASATLPSPVTSEGYGLRASSFVFELGLPPKEVSTRNSVFRPVVNDFRKLCELRKGVIAQDLSSGNIARFAIYCVGANDSLLFGFTLKDTQPKTRLNSSESCGGGERLYLISGVALDPTRPMKIDEYLSTFTNSLQSRELPVPPSRTCGNYNSSNYHTWTILSREETQQIAKEREKRVQAEKDKIEHETRRKSERIEYVNKNYSKILESDAETVFARIVRVFTANNKARVDLIYNFRSPRMAPNKMPIRSYELRVIYDCENWTEAPVSGTWYEGEMTTGNHVDGFEIPYEKHKLQDPYKREMKAVCDALRRK